MKFLYAIALFFITANNIFPQEFSKAIEDNSFFIEEAYNQEDGVVQHIFNVSYFSKPQKDIELSFTQEWPFFCYKHQLSVTIPFSILNSNTVSGFNDILLNYRYQLFYKDDWASVSPRFSLVIPTGNYDKGLGSDVVGYQFAIPATKRISDAFVTHANIGINFLPAVKNISGGNIDSKKDLSDYFAGVSLIWLANTNLNFMLEYLYTNAAEFNAAGNVIHSSENIISPGIRAAININSLQIVPGIAVPISFSSGETRTGLFLYLSFEHPF